MNLTLSLLRLHEIGVKDKEDFLGRILFIPSSQIILKTLGMRDYFYFDLRD